MWGGNPHGRRDGPVVLQINSGVENRWAAFRGPIVSTDWAFSNHSVGILKTAEQAGSRRPPPTECKCPFYLDEVSKRQKEEYVIILSVSCLAPGQTDLIDAFLIPLYFRIGTKIEWVKAFVCFVSTTPPMNDDED